MDYQSNHTPRHMRDNYQYVRDLLDTIKSIHNLTKYGAGNYFDLRERLESIMTKCRHSIDRSEQNF